jgi:hypothetical protein
MTEIDIAVATIAVLPPSPTKELGDMTMSMPLTVTRVLRSRRHKMQRIESKHHIEDNDTDDTDPKFESSVSSSSSSTSIGSSSSAKWYRSIGSSALKGSSMALGSPASVPLGNAPFQLIFSYLTHREHCSLAATQYIAAIVARSSLINIVMFPYDTLSLEQFLKWSSRIRSVELYFVPNWFISHLYHLKRLVSLSILAEDGQRESEIFDQLNSRHGGHSYHRQLPLLLHYNEAPDRIDYQLSHDSEGDTYTFTKSSPLQYIPRYSNDPQFGVGFCCLFV